MSGRCPDPIELSRALVQGLGERLEAHVATCTRCAAQLASHAQVAGEARALPTHEPAIDHARAVRSALLTAAATRAPAIGSRRRLWTFGFVAATACAAAVLVFVMRRDPAPVTPAVAYRGTIHAHDGAAYLRVGGAPDEIVRLTHGTITVDVRPLAIGERFRVITADSEVEVHGTAFDITADHDRLTAVRVLHGHVEVRAAGADPKIYSAGERWEMKLAAAEPAPPSAPIDDDAIVIDPVDPIDRAEAADPIVPSAKKPARTQVATRVPATRVPATESPQPSVASRANTESTASRPTGTVDPKPTPSSGSSSITTANRGSPATPALKRPIELLFEQGWVALAAGKTQDAASTFERAAKSAPDDPLAEDAWFWRATALARANSGAATGALDQFLSRYPRSPRAGEASAVLGWRLIGNDLERAARLFQVAARDRVPAVRASGEKGLAAIAKKKQQGSGD